MIKLLYNNWNQINIDTFNKIEEVINDEDLSEVEKNVALIAIFTGLEEDEVLNIEMSEINSFLTDINTFFNVEIPKNKRNIKEININGDTYTVYTDLNKFSYAAYVDFQTYIQDGDEKLAQVLSTFVIPKGKKYATDYDIAETIELFKNNIDIITARSLVNFFIASLLDLTKNSLISYRRVMKKMMKKEKMGKEIIGKMEEMMNQLTDLVG